MADTKGKDKDAKDAPTAPAGTKKKTGMDKGGSGKKKGK